MADEPAIVVERDPEAVAAAVAGRIAATLARAIPARGRADWATTGGSTPGPIYRHLASAPLRDEVDWDRVHIWFGDDRFVPRDHPLSNALPLDGILLADAARSGQSGTGTEGLDVIGGPDPGVVIPPDQVHVIPSGRALSLGESPDWAAATYATEIRDEGVPVTDGWPAFDLVLLGVGPDGHIQSVFPGSAALDSDAWALGIPAPTHVEPHIARVTLNPRILDVAGEVVVVAHGSAKTSIVGSIFGPERDPHQWPAQLARRASATWFLDDAAAAAIPETVRRRDW